MNTIIFEIKSNLSSVIIWLIALVGMLGLMMLGAYPVYSHAIDDITVILMNFPPEFSAAFGLNLQELFSYGGFYNFSYGYIVLLGAIMAASISINIFSREKRAKCSDFLLTKPVSREQIFINKFISCIVIIVVTNIIFLISAVIMYQISGDSTYSVEKLMIASLGLFFTQILFMGFGIAFSILTKKISSVAGSATALGFGGFILTAIANVLNDDKLNFIAILKYFEPNYIFINGKYETKYIFLALFIFIICLVASGLKFIKSDVHAI